ncbi:MAG: type II methionyl aminopeptidase [Candidatus Thorarchaeota archaeon]|jgi:methionyl aminopeptidase
MRRVIELVAVSSPPPDFIKAGRLASRVLKETAEQVRPGVKVLKVCTFAEKKTLEYGGGIAFPCNVSINEEAAHYTSPHGDTRTFPDKGLVKVDVGTHINGHIADTAVTIDLDGSLERFIAAARAGLDAAIEVVRPGIQVGEVGAAIEQAIKKHGLRPIHQLSGHQMKQWNLHAGNNVPNVRTRRSPKMKLGETYAVEPFATDGNGTIKSGSNSYIFSNVMSNKKKLDSLTSQVRKAARQKFGTLPWASRWLDSSKVNVTAALNALLRAEAIRDYPVLLEGKGGMVSQFEHSFFVAEDGPIVTTLRE